MFKTLKSLAAAAAVMLAPPLHAQPPPEGAQHILPETAQVMPMQQLRCGPHDKVTELLRDRYLEQQGGLGIIRKHFLIEVYVSNE